MAASTSNPSDSLLPLLSKAERHVEPVFATRSQLLNFVTAVICWFVNPHLASILAAKLTKSSLFGGSLTTFSLYANQFLTHLHYTQYQVNGISVSAELAMCLPVAFYGYLCDRYSPAPLALLSGSLFATGYLLAALAYRADESLAINNLPSQYYGSMVTGFMAVGAATSCMHIAALATCAKAFGSSPRRGLLLSAPLAAFGLSGMWQSQLGVAVFTLRDSDVFEGDIDVFAYLMASSAALLIVGLVGTFGLRLRAKSGLHACCETSPLQTDRNFAVDGGEETAMADRQIAQPFWRKALDHEKLEFFRDRNMWLLAAGFFLASGVGEAYINNVSVSTGHDLRSISQTEIDMLTENDRSAQS